MRGTGCSGGAFDYFEPLQNLDAYDVIQTIAHQPWVLHHKVGNARRLLRRDQPALRRSASAAGPRGDRAAVGGRRNGDDALPRWHPQHRFRRAVGRRTPARRRTGRPRPAASTGPTNRSRKAITTCAANQDLHEEATNLLAEIKENATYNPSVADPLDPVTFVHNINVPTFMACQWEDEQTGGHCADLAEHFTGTERKWFTFTNGAHIDSLDPYTFNRLYDFLELFVAHQAPINNRAILRCRGADHLSGGVGTPDGRQGHAAAGPDPGTADIRRGAVGLHGAPGDSGAVRQRRRSLADRQHDARQPLSRRSNSRSRRSRYPARRLARGTSGRKARSMNSRQRPRGSTPTPRMRAPRR